MDATVLKIMRITLVAIGQRAMTFVSLVMTFALSLYVMWQPDLIRLGIAAFFGLFICLPAMMRESKPSAQES